MKEIVQPPTNKPFNGLNNLNKKKERKQRGKCRTLNDGIIKEAFLFQALLGLSERVEISLESVTTPPKALINREIIFVLFPLRQEPRGRREPSGILFDGWQ